MAELIISRIFKIDAGLRAVDIRLIERISSATLYLYSRREGAIPAGIGFTQPVVSPCAALFGQGRARRRSCRVRPGDVPPFGQRRAARAQCIPQGCV